MPPRKMYVRRRKQQAQEASTSAAPEEIVPEVQAPAEAPPTPPRELLSDEVYAQERKEKLERMTILNHQYLDWDLLREYGMYERIQEMVTDKTWFKLFAINEPAYRDITIEFLSTMTIKKTNTLSTMTFQAYGQIHTIELSQMGMFLGFYDHTQEEEIDELPTTWPDDMNAERFWFQLIHPRKDHFVPSASLSTAFTDMEPKLLHHILAHTICCKKTSHSKVTSFDMFYLYSMMSGYQIDIGVEVANFLQRQITDTRTRFIMCGGYVTALLKGMGIFQLPEGDNGVACKKISSGPFRTWGLKKATIRAEPAEEAGVQAVSPTDRASTSHPLPPGSELEELRSDIRELRKKARKERRKNKKFRTTMFDMLKSALSCFQPGSTDQFHYTTSDESSSTEPES